MGFDDYYDEEFYDRRRTYNARDMRKHGAEPGVHIPNKNEGALLRKLMSDNKMTEEEVRSHKKYRKMLSDSQKVPTAKRTSLQKIYDGIMKQACRQTKLAKEHPDTIKAYNEIIEEQKGKYWSKIGRALRIGL